VSGGMKSGEESLKDEGGSSASCATSGARGGCVGERHGT